MLNERQIPTRTGDNAVGTIYSWGMLRNPAYRGRAEVGNWRGAVGASWLYPGFPLRAR